MFQQSLDDLGTPLHEATFCVLDLETTGGRRDSDMITEIGAVKYRGGEQLGVFQTLIDPCLLYTSPSPRDPKTSRMPSSA